MGMALKSIRARIGEIWGLKRVSDGMRVKRWLSWDDAKGGA